jgi:prepilin-type N-terminal cleavage/methylation domain-containing protein
MLSYKSKGFTLLEMSIVLVVIGLVLGGVLAGKELIVSARARAQISQIQSYYAATNLFVDKYKYLPGDIPDPIASKYGFSARGSNPGQGDGNGVIEGWTGSGAFGAYELIGEIPMFWSDLTYANGMNINLIDGNFTMASLTTIPSIGGIPQGAVNQVTVNSFIPPAKISNNNVYVWSTGGINYFAIANIWVIDGLIEANAIIPVRLAYAIDQKMDDGLPQSGMVTARAPMWPNASAPVQWAGDGGAAGNTVIHVTGAGPLGAEPPSGGPTSDSCYDNNSTAGVVSNYSMKTNNGNNNACALSFQFP